MTAALTSILALIEQFLPLLGAAATPTSTIGVIITTLESLLPTIISVVPEVYTSVKNIITALTADPSTTPAQLSTLQALDAQVDAAFDAAATTLGLNTTTTAS
jgi:hypothetical protein